MCNEQHVHVAISDGADGADGADGIGGGRSLNQVLHDGCSMLQGANRSLLTCSRNETEVLSFLTQQRPHVDPLSHPPC